MTDYTDERDHGHTRLTWILEPLVPALDPPERTSQAQGSDPGLEGTAAELIIH